MPDTFPGHYIHADASHGNTSDQTGYLSTPKISTSDWHCLSMWYHMYGDHVGEFQVYHINHDKNQTLLLNKTGLCNFTSPK